MGTSEPSLRILNKLSELYNVDMHTLYSVDLEAGNNSDNENTNRIPLLGTIAAGLPILAEENIEDYFYIDKSICSGYAFVYFQPVGILGKRGRIVSYVLKTSVKTFKKFFEKSIDSQRLS